MRVSMLQLLVIEGLFPLASLSGITTIIYVTLNALCKARQSYCQLDVPT